MNTSMSLRVIPEWKEIERVRLRCREFLGEHGLRNDAIHTLTMVISELVENGIKYGEFRNGRKKLKIKASIEGNTFNAEISNPVGEGAQQHLKRLDRTIQWIRGYQDPFEAYVKRLKEVSKRPLYDEESGLGLVRIAYEGTSILDFFVGEDELLNVSAISHLGKDCWR